MCVWWCLCRWEVEGFFFVFCFIVLYDCFFLGANIFSDDNISSKKVLLWTVSANLKMSLLLVWTVLKGCQIKQIKERETLQVFTVNWTICNAKQHMFTLTTLRCNACPGAIICILTRVPTILAGLQDFSGGGLPAHTTAGWAGTPLGPAGPLTVHCRRTK